MINKAIVLTACLVVIVLVIGGLVSRQSGYVSSGLLLLGVLLGAAGIKYQPQIQGIFKKKV